MPFKITQIWAFVMVRDDGEEAIPALPAPGPFPGSTMFVPAIAADESRLRSLLPGVQQYAQAMNKTFRLVRFSQMTDVTESLR